MHLITYMSDYSGNDNTVKQDLADITKVAKVQNALRQITGVLFYTEGKFLQVVEGEEKFLRQLMYNIENDNRHANLTYLIDTPIEKRGFYDWNMDSFNFANGQKFNVDNMQALSKSFSENLLPRSDTLVMFYKKILEKT